MKIQIDTTAKTLKIEGTADLSELFDTLENILPNGGWKTYKLETNTIIKWESPIYIDKCRPPYWTQLIDSSICGTNISSNTVKGFPAGAQVSYTSSGI